MKPSPISLIDYFATELSCLSNKAFDAAKEIKFVESEYCVSTSTTKNSSGSAQERRWQVSLEIRHQVGPQTNFPYSYRIALVGLFSVSPWVKEEDEERTVKVHGASVLYGMAREIARALTGRGPHRPVLLPTVSFYEAKPQEKVEAEKPAPALVPEKTQKKRKKL